MMKNLLALFLFTQFNLYAFAQQHSYSTMLQNTPVATVVDMSSSEADYAPQIMLVNSAIEAPIPGTVKYNKQEIQKLRNTYLTQKQTAQTNFKTALAPPTIIKGFIANGSQGTPNDNDLATGKDGKVVSVVNSTIFIYDSTGKLLSNKSLAFFAKQLGTLNRTFDPRAIYDPVADRYIVVFLQGSTSEDTRIITSFSKTNDPTGLWNCYAIDGNVFGDSSWSDYPIISLSQNELFITVNRLKDNTSWQEGFMESLIWQVNKQSGYNGDTLKQKIYYNIKYNNQPIWSICPVKGSHENYGPNAHFISVRPSALSNDTIFFHEISNTLENNPQLTLKVLKTNTSYGLQPNAKQPSGQYLQTNDARVLCAARHAYIVHFVGNTVNPITYAPSVYYGRINMSTPENPTVTGEIISYDSMDIAYPSIAYAGGGFHQDQTMMIDFSHVSTSKHPGNSLVIVDKLGNVSAPIHLKEGEGSTNMLGDSIERWGDYSGIQPNYAKMGECVIANSFGVANTGRNGTWITRVQNIDPLLGNNNQQISKQQLVVYPNPANSYFECKFKLTHNATVKVNIYDMNGRLIENLLQQNCLQGEHAFIIKTNDLPTGIYLLKIESDEKNLATKRIVVNH